MGETKIEWATHTANWLAGCMKISPACQHCYAETMTARLATMPHAPARYRDGVVRDRRWTWRVTYDADALRAAFDGLHNAKSPRRVFCNSMSDTFHENAPPESLDDLAAAISSLRDVRSDHVLMLLTKRPRRLLEWQRLHFPDGLPSWVWVGCTVEDQRRADERIPVLLKVAAKVRFLSCEPLLGPVQLGVMVGERCSFYDYGLGERAGSIAWVIVGGESGPSARPMHPEWARSLRDQCVGAGVALHFKQWGEWAPDDAIEGAGIAHGWYEQGREDGGVPCHWWHDSGLRRTIEESGMVVPDGEIGGDTRVYLVGKRAAGRLLDGRTWDEFPGEVRGG